MKKMFMFIVLFLAFGIVIILLWSVLRNPSAKVAEKPAVDVGIDIETIKSVINQLSYAHDSGNLDSFLATQTEDIILMPPSEESLYGKDSVRERFAPMFELFNL